MLFLDTGAFLARYLTADEHHQRARSIWKKLDGVPLFTSNHVLDETLSLLARRAGYGFAAERACILYASPSLDILYSTKEDETNAIRLLRKFADQKMSFTDCVSFVLMERFRIPSAFTFDRHFVAAGFRTVGL